MIDIIIPTLKKPHLGKCLEAIKENTPEGEYMVHLITEGQSWGEAINIGFEKTTNDVVIMDDDILVNPGWIQNALFFRRIADVIGYKLISPEGKIHHAGSFYRSGLIRHWGTGQIDGGEYSFPYYCPHVTFSLVYIKREVIEKVGHIDTETFLGYQFEDVDYSARMLLAGFRILYTPHPNIHFVTHTKRAFPDFHARMRENREAFKRKWADNEKLVALFESYQPLS